VLLLILRAFSKQYHVPYRVGFTLCLAGAIGAGIGIADWREDSTAIAALYDGPHQIVEGVVSDFEPMPYEGHKDECFSVQQQSFCYSDYWTTPGFHRSASHGGPIREGLPVRITYHDGMILRLQIPAEQVVGSSEAAATDKASEQDWKRRIDADPVERCLMTAFYFTMLGWVIWWNIKWKLVMSMWVRPPYGRWTEIAFRLFFAANLVNAIIGLVSFIWAHPVSKSEILPNLITTCSMGAVVALMSFVGVRAARNRQFARNP